MIHEKEILSLNFYSYGKPFTGSDAGMRYRIMMEKGEEENHLSAWCWKEPFSFENTREEIFHKEFPMSEEGRLEAVAWLNDMHGQVAG